jgi:sterol desaturase/sphingolipid hydroxylase (fatty acid hydroxylase superfamily)
METISPVLFASIFGSLVVVLFVLERVRPLRHRTRSPWRRIAVNVVITALAFGTGFLVVRTGTVNTAEWASASNFGLLNLLPIPAWLHFVLGFLLMDLTFYYWHRINHEIPVLWRFHNVHHVDPDLDVSTSFRFHFGEVLYSVVFRVLQVGLLGVSLITLAVFELVFQCATAFHHSNFRIPVRIERWINRVFVTPRMHGIHHSDVRNETNSNYSVIFRWWDALHRTLRLGIPQAAVRIGVPAYRDFEDNRVTSLLAAPFRKQKDFWRRPDGTESTRDAVMVDKGETNALTE